METQRATRDSDVADDYDNDVDEDVDEDDNTDASVDSDAMHEDVVLSNFGDEEVKDLVRPIIIYKIGKKHYKNIRDRLLLLLNRANSF
jgi:hypothetical protein